MKLQILIFLCADMMLDKMINHLNNLICTKRNTLHTQNTKAIVCFFQERPNHQATLRPPVLHQGEQIVQDACIYQMKNQTKKQMLYYTFIHSF